MTILLDVEIEMHAFRLMRSGNYSKGAAVLKALQEDFPEVAEQRLRECCVRLAERLLKDHPH